VLFYDERKERKERKIELGYTVLRIVLALLQDPMYCTPVCQ
jgi:hypothetical protein